MLISGRAKERSRIFRVSFQHSGACIICANSKCKESTDHQYMDFYKFKELAINARQDNPQIQEAKEKVKDFFKLITATFIEYAQNSCLSALENINAYYYHHLNKLKTEQLKILCQVLENDAKSLPSKKAWTIATTLADVCNQRQFNFDNLKFQCDFPEVLSDIESQIKRFNCSEFGQNLKNYMIRFESVFDKQQKLTSSSLGCSKSSRFSQSSSNEDEILEWKNLRIRSIVKNVVLNCKKISDSEFLMNLPKLEKFSNIIQFEARQNLITHLSCIGINNHLPQLISLDLRSNNIGDIGVGKLKNMINLRQLMINENGVTDRSADFIHEGFPVLEVLWADGNNFTESGIFALCKKQVLKICSVIGNQIDPRFFYEIKGLFSRKGLIYI